MDKHLNYGPTAKVLHWLIVFLLSVQYLLGWFMPDIHRGMSPGNAMTLHISVGILILLLITLRFVWRLAHPVSPESSLPAWQRFSSEGVHWLLYGLVLATTISGWLFASQRGWSISLFYELPLPMLTQQGSTVARAIGAWHQAMEWCLLILIGIHMAAGLAHVFVYRDSVMQRMLPNRMR